ncbi:hypothetical protein QTG54_009334 [Skeletonema marinoi]|uniref:rRNA-processing protein FYV7 n=1 Tax=Skeletonema marinoi TaxID=267567 RepID=A0AAD9DBD1_9STRA|nr:hypothetical protein QTG54_009334 [Skeletonema marinoi]
MSSNNKPYRRRVRLDADEAPTDRTQTHRRKKAAISLNSFSSKKGHDQCDIAQRVSARDEAGGVEVGKGASRWRDEEGRKGSKKRTNTTDEDEFDDYADETYEQRKARTKRLKSDPLLKARKLAEQRKAEKEELSHRRKQKQRTRAKKLMKRTRKGQPVMKNVIGDLLGRIKSEVGET